MQLPLNLVPGESQKIYLKVGLSLRENASQIIKDAPLEQITRIMDLSKYLAGAGNIDIFDNPVEPFWDNEKKRVIGFKVLDQSNDQELYIELQTSKKKTYSDISKWYDFPNLKN